MRYRRMIGIIWNPMNYDFEKALDVMKNNGALVNKTIKPMLTSREYKEFILDLYQVNPDYPTAGPLKVSQLVDKYQSNTIMIITYGLLDDASEILDEKKGRYVNKTISLFKKKVRASLAELIREHWGSYEFEISFHSNDDDKEYLELEEKIGKLIGEDRYG